MRFKIVVSLAFACLLLGWAFQTRHKRQPGNPPLNQPSPGIELIPAEAIPATLHSFHPVWPYSVIPGGVYSRAELARWIEDDATVRQHYAGFKMSQARLVRLKEDRRQYVSYRQGDRIYWTKKRIVIPRGELLITDGNRFARTRCGNMLSDLPHASALADEPSAAIQMPHFEPETAQIHPDGSVQLPGDTDSVLLQPPEIPTESGRHEIDGQMSRLLPPGNQLRSLEVLTESPPARVALRPESDPPPPLPIPEPGFLFPVALGGLCLFFGGRRLTRRTPPTTLC